MEVLCVIYAPLLVFKASFKICIYVSKHDAVVSALKSINSRISLLVSRVAALFVARLATTAASSVATPPWGDLERNPCTSEPNGWQLLFWPLDGKCYKIFQKGYPCPESMELTLGKGGVAECQCPPGTAQSPRDAICYKLFSRGPCDENEYFAPIAADPKRHRWGVCVRIERCKEGEVFWPKDKKCQPAFKRGPCPQGLLLGEQDGIGECKCDPAQMSSHYWEPSASCYDHYVQGPCEKGQVFLPEGTCGCDQALEQYHPETEKCYSIGTIGPCAAGNKFQAAFNETTELVNGVCTCKDGHLLWPENGQCYRPFTRGPCGLGGMLEVDYENVSIIDLFSMQWAFKPKNSLTKNL
ncbi:unnamed protein product [Nesidiocoris tenuis]|uniref:DUF4789 domain-containing protein n=1 Tax=Nesidiocoris tenuis TaxID=355587 RepID=A0A6H5HT48_9HEMI|nr:unnamed protein product [Nesidiocoris tenuis]